MGDTSRLIVAAIALCSALLPTQAAAVSPAKQVFDYIFVVDTSGSMAGKGSGNPAVIIPKVKDSITAQIEGLEDGATVVVMPFSDGVKETKRFRLTSDADRLDAVRYVKGLTANGSSTWIYTSIWEALSEARRLANSSALHVQKVLLYTDGRDNQSGQHRTFKEIAKEFRLQRGEGDNLWLTYLTLGVSAPRGDKSVIASTEGMSLIENPKGSVLPFHNVEVRPYVLDFGNLRHASKSSVTVRFSFASEAKGLSYDVELDEGSGLDALLSAGVNPVIKSSSRSLGEKSTLTFSLENTAGLASVDTTFSGTIRFKSDEGLQFNPPVVPISFRLVEQPKLALAPVDQRSAQDSVGALHRTHDAVATLKRRWSVQWSAPKPSARVTLRIWPSPKNPIVMAGQSVRLRTSSGRSGSSVVLSPQDKWVELTVSPAADSAAGAYSFDIVAGVEGADLVFTGAHASPDDPTTMVATTEFQIPGRPLSIGTTAVISIGVLLALLLAGFGAYCAITAQGPVRAARDLLYVSGIKKPVFGTEQLVVREPSAEAGRAYPMSGRSSVLIGSPQGDFLSESAGAVRIEATWNRQHLGARAIAVEGDACCKQAGDAFDMPFAETELGHGDVIRVGSFAVQFESGDIARFE